MTLVVYGDEKRGNVQKPLSAEESDHNNGGNNVSAQEWTWQELFRGGAVMLSVFAAMYVLIFVEIVLSYTPEGADGPILTLFKTVFGYSRDLAGYYMVLVLDVLMMVGGGLCFYGAKWVTRGLNLRRKSR